MRNTTAALCAMAACIASLPVQAAPRPDAAPLIGTWQLAAQKNDPGFYQRFAGRTLRISGYVLGRMTPDRYSDHYALRIGTTAKEGGGADIACIYKPELDAKARSLAIGQKIEFTGALSEDNGPKGVGTALIIDIDPCTF